jgi:hypothetical protein
MTMTAPLAPLQQLGVVGQRSLGQGLDYQNTAAANSNYWDMLNNIGSAWGSMGTSGKGGGGVQCWVAMELYGANDERVSLIRDYLNEQLETDSLVGQFARWYARNGKAIADGIGSGIIAPKPWQSLFANLRRMATA